MTIAFPYTLVACPCSEEAEVADATAHPRRSSVLPIRVPDDDEDEEDEPLNPHNPRSNFKLYPYNQLLFCDECQQIRCPRCWAEETTHWYCPTCIFEVASSSIKSDGNRCTRNCYNCPICTSLLVVNGLDQQPASGTETSMSGGPWFLSCTYCDWSSLDLGIEFSKPNKITEQLQRLRQARSSVSTSTSGDTGPQQDADVTAEDDSPEKRFSRLTKFYETQITESDAAAAGGFGLDASYSSPSNLARIMQLYGGLSASSLKKSREKPSLMREALSPSEGLKVMSPSSDDQIITRLRSSKLSDLTTSSQRSSHPWNHSARFVSDLWPVPTLLKTKKSKRCRACRHILIRYDDRKATGSSSSSSSSAVTTMKYKIRLLAQNNIPRLSLRPFYPSTSSAKDFPTASFALTPSSLSSLTASLTESYTLRPNQTRQYLLVVTNPLFETVHITLATPSVTPGPIPAKTLLLCPTFSLGPDGDMWDSALDATKSSSTSRGALAGGPGQRSLETQDETVVPEAGKVWERGRNWAAVVVEVTMPSSPSAPSDVDVHDGEEEEGFEEYCDRMKKERMQRCVNEDVLEIPVLVRAEWSVDLSAAAGATPSATGAREGREFNFWCVLGAGKVERS